MRRNFVLMLFFFLLLLAPHYSYSQDSSPTGNKSKLIFDISAALMNKRQITTAAKDIAYSKTIDDLLKPFLSEYSIEIEGTNASMAADKLVDKANRIWSVIQTIESVSSSLGAGEYEKASIRAIDELVSQLSYPPLTAVWEATKMAYKSQKDLAKQVSARELEELYWMVERDAYLFGQEKDGVRLFRINKTTVDKFFNKYVINNEYSRKLVRNYVENVLHEQWPYHEDKGFFSGGGKSTESEVAVLSNPKNKNRVRNWVRIILKDVNKQLVKRRKEQRLQAAYLEFKRFADRFKRLKTSLPDILRKYMAAKEAEANYNKYLGFLKDSSEDRYKVRAQMKSPPTITTRREFLKLYNSWQAKLTEAWNKSSNLLYGRKISSGDAIGLIDKLGKELNSWKKLYNEFMSYLDKYDDQGIDLTDDVLKDLDKEYSGNSIAGGFGKFFADCDSDLISHKEVYAQAEKYFRIKVLPVLEEYTSSYQFQDTSIVEHEFDNALMNGDFHKANILLQKWELQKSKIYDFFDMRTYERRSNELLGGNSPKISYEKTALLEKLGNKLKPPSELIRLPKLVEKDIKYRRELDLKIAAWKLAKEVLFCEWVANKKMEYVMRVNVFANKLKEKLSIIAELRSAALRYTKALNESLADLNEEVRWCGGGGLYVISYYKNKFRQLSNWNFKKDINTLDSNIQNVSDYFVSVCNQLKKELASHIKEAYNLISGVNGLCDRERASSMLCNVGKIKRIKKVPPPHSSLESFMRTDFWKHNFNASSRRMDYLDYKEYSQKFDAIKSNIGNIGGSCSLADSISGQAEDLISKWNSLMLEADRAVKDFYDWEQKERKYGVIDSGVVMYGVDKDGYTHNKDGSYMSKAQIEKLRRDLMARVSSRFFYHFMSMYMPEFKSKYFDPFISLSKLRAAPDEFIKRHTKRGGERQHTQPSVTVVTPGKGASSNDKTTKNPELLPQNYYIEGLRINNRPAGGRQMLLSDKDLIDSKIVISGRIVPFRGVRRLLISIDNGRTYKNIIENNGRFHFSFMPKDNMEYRTQFKVITTEGDNLLVNGGYADIVYLSEGVNTVIKAVTELASAYEREDLSAFNRMVANDFLGGKMYLINGIRTDFDLFNNISLKIYVNRTEQRGDMLVAECRWEKTQYPVKTMQQQRTTGTTYMMFKVSREGLKLYSLRGNLLFATLSAEIAQASGLNSSVVDKIRTAYSQRNPVQPGAGEVVEDGGVSDSSSSAGSSPLTVKTASVIFPNDGSNNATIDFTSAGFNTGSADFEIETNIFFQYLGSSATIQKVTQNFDSLTEAPAGGYSVTAPIGGFNSGDVFAFITNEGLYGKVEVVSYSDDGSNIHLSIKWAVQTDGSRDLTTN